MKDACLRDDQSETIQRRKRIVPVAIVLLTVIGAFLFERLCVKVAKGETGVLWKRFDGGTESRYYDEGRYFVSPFNVMYTYDTELQQVDLRSKILSSDGSTIEINASVWIRPRKEQLHLLHQKIGPDYRNIVVVPETQAAIRKVFGQYDIGKIYLNDGDLDKEVFVAVGQSSFLQYVSVEELRITKIDLFKPANGVVDAEL